MDKQSASRVKSELLSPCAESEVGLFIDWENFKKGVEEVLGREPDLSVIKKAAAQYGRLAVARAYANWQSGQFPKDCELLFTQGIDPLFASSGEKNSADIRMAIEAVEQSVLRREMRTVILVSGDRDFIPVIGLLKTHGKRVVVVATSGHFTPAMTFLPDRFLLYEELATGYIQSHGSNKERSDVAFKALEEAVIEADAGQLDHSAPSIKAMIRRRLADFEEEDLGFPRFEHFLYAGEHRKLVRVDATVWPQRVYPVAATETRNHTTLFDRDDWVWFIRYMKKVNTPRHPNTLTSDVIKARTTLAEQAAELITVARLSGVLIKVKEARFNVKDNKSYAFEGVQFNEQNPRVQVYLGLREPTPKA